eukprot:1791863-Prymnesium_polylepis.1
MSALPGWLTGAQHICINTSMCDLTMQLHFALFNTSQGCVLKPLEMRQAHLNIASVHLNIGTENLSKGGSFFFDAGSERTTTTALSRHSSE